MNYDQEVERLIAGLEPKPEPLPEMEALRKRFIGAYSPAWPTSQRLPIVLLSPLYYPNGLKMIEPQTSQKSWEPTPCSKCGIAHLSQVEAAIHAANCQGDEREGKR